MNIALALTLSRFVLVGPIIYFLLADTFIENRIVSIAVVVILYICGGVSDYLDGKYARKLGQTSRTGEFLDPLADKVFTLGVFIAFLYIDLFYLPVWIIMVIVAREVLITTVRIVAISRELVMKTEKHGKIKTVSQFTAQGVTWAILLTYAIIFETGSYRSFIGSSNVTRPYSYDTYLRFNESTGLIPSLASLILYYLPLLFIGISACLTVYSGISYFLTNRDLLFKGSKQ